MYTFWNECVKPKYEINVKLFYMDTDGFIVYYLIVYCKNR